MVLALAAAGCSPQGQSGRGPERPAVPDVRPLTGATAATVAEATLLHDRVEQAVAACMAERGHAYTPRPRTASGRGEETNPYGLLTPRKAAADGYGLVGEYHYLRTTPRPKAQPHGRSWQRALTGTPAHRVRVRTPDGLRFEFSSDGCVARGAERVYGKGWNRLRPVAAGLANRVLEAVGRQPGYRAAIRRWSQCMTEAGHPAKDFQATREAIDARLAKATKGSAPPDPAVIKRLGRDELNRATADADCQVRTKIGKTVARTQREVERKLLSTADRRTIARYTDLKQRALDAGVDSDQQAQETPERGAVSSSAGRFAGPSAVS
ncbi:hypothetical protein [Streptomyces boninensis]|uniref:hypothetical protein n=1 Tax=Streptomyces boninensis TaxID=2039455 RepID=UPI003B213CB6